jgi:hypothetical protein
MGSSTQPLRWRGAAGWVRARGLVSKALKTGRSEAKGPGAKPMPVLGLQRNCTR